MFWDILFYGIIIIGAALLIGLTVYRIDWARHSALPVGIPPPSPRRDTGFEQKKAPRGAIQA